MRLFERLSLLIKADAHGVMDSLEERSLLMKQHLREAEIALGQKRAQLDALEDERQQLAKQADRQRAELEALDEDVELALAAEKEELARFSLRQLIPKRRAVAALQARASELSDAASELSQLLPAQEAELEELRARVKVQLSAVEERSSACDFTPPGVPDEEIELELLRRREAAEGGAA